MTDDTALLNGPAGEKKIAWRVFIIKIFFSDVKTL
jgi:hypothetical protein